NDGITAVDPNMAAENGTGSKLKIAFVAYNAGIIPVGGTTAGLPGIYLMYNCSINEQNATSAGVLAYSSNVAWRASATPTAVAFTVGSTGLLNLSLNGTPVFTNVQLPAGYVSANKSNWYHIFKARTGGVSEEHSIDNMTVRVAQIQSTPTPGQNISVMPTVAGTYTYYVTATDGACATQSTVTVVANPPAAAISAGDDVSLCDGNSVTLSASSAGLIPALRITESLWQVNAGTGPTGAGIPAWCSNWYNANGGTTADMLEITNLGAGPATSAGVSIEFWNAASTTSGSPLYSYTIPASASLMSPGGLLYFSHSGATTVNDLTNNFFTNAQNLNNTSGTAGGWVLRKNGVIIDAMAVSGYTFPAASGVTSADWSGTLPSNSGLSGSILVAPDNNTSSSWVNTSALQTASVGTLNAGLVANLPSLGTVAWSSIPAGFTGTQATSTFGPITQPTSFVVMFDNGTCQSYDTVLVTPVTTPASPVITSNRDSICISGVATYSSSGVTQGTTLMWQYYNTATSTWTNTDSTRSSYISPVITPVLGDSIIYIRLASFCSANPSYSNVDTLQIVKPFISSLVNDTVCGIGQLDLAAYGNGTMNWYQTSNSTTLLSTGNTYSTTTLSNVVYWVRASVGTCLDPAGRQPVFGIVNPAPAITTSPNVTLCENLSTTMTVSSPADTNGYYTYTWQPGNVTGNSYTVTPSATTTYTVVATSATGCGNYGAVTVTVNTRPVIATIGATNSTICQGASTSLSLTLGNSGGPQVLPAGYCAGGGSATTADEQIFAFSFGSMSNTQAETCGNNNSDYTSTIAPVTVVAGLSYPWSCTVDECDGATYFSSGLSIFIDYNRDGDWDDAGEQAYTSGGTALAPVTRTGSITIPTTVTPGWTRMRVAAMESITSPTACGTFSYGEVEDYTVNILASSGTTVWTPGNLSGNSVTVTPSATTTYTATVTSTNGCTQSGVTTVTVLPFNNPVAITPSGPTTVCQPGTVTLNAGSDDSYLWSNGETTQSITVSASGNYSVTASNTNGCSGTASQSVTVNPFVAPVINSSRSSICVGADQATLNVIGTYATYSWSDGSTTSSITVADTGTYSVTVSTAQGCSGTASFTLAGSAAPITPVILADDSVFFCWDGVSVGGSQFLIADAYGQSVSWNDPAGSTDDFVILNVGNGVGEYGYGTYNISITAQGSGGCIAADSIKFVVVANPTPSISASATAVCAGDAA
ncbi:MAG: beta strand repeat-containing protein, partial [Flavobacteriales bacterium]